MEDAVSCELVRWQGFWGGTREEVEAKKLMDWNIRE